MCLKSGSQLACQAPGALPSIDTIHRGEQSHEGTKLQGGQSYREDKAVWGSKAVGDKQGTSGPGWLDRTTTTCLPLRGFAQPTAPYLCRQGRVRGAPIPSVWYVSRHAGHDDSVNRIGSAIALHFRFLKVTSGS